MRERERKGSEGEKRQGRGVTDPPLWA